MPLNIGRQIMPQGGALAPDFKRNMAGGMPPPAAGGGLAALGGLGGAPGGGPPGAMPGALPGGGLPGQAPGQAMPAMDSGGGPMPAMPEIPDQAGAGQVGVGLAPGGMGGGQFPQLGGGMPGGGMPGGGMPPGGGEHPMLQQYIAARQAGEHPLLRRALAAHQSGGAPPPWLQGLGAAGQAGGDGEQPGLLQIGRQRYGGGR